MVTSPAKKDLRRFDAVYRVVHSFPLLSDKNLSIQRKNARRIERNKLVGLSKPGEVD
jgi:hypothetical protein